MTTPSPLWRRAVLLVERGIGRPLESIVASQTFNDAFVLTFRAQGAVQRAFESQTRAVLHFWNLPAYSDLVRLRRQVGTLEVNMQELSARLGERGEVERS